jgi:hypothetical protein
MNAKLVVKALILLSFLSLSPHPPGSPVQKQVSLFQNSGMGKEEKGRKEGTG